MKEVRTTYRLLFLTGLFPGYCEKEIEKCSIGQPQNAANNLQYEIVSGLLKQHNIQLEILNLPYLGAFPFNYTKMTSPSPGKVEIDGIVCGDNLQFINIVLLKHYFRRVILKRKIHKIAKERNNKEKTIILAYALTSDNISCAAYAKKIIPNSQTCFIVPDLPEYMDTRVSDKISDKVRRYIKNYDMKYIYNHLDNVDGFILLTKFMAERLRASKYIVMEGVAPENEYAQTTIKVDREVILYTGTLNKKYGVVNLIDAFRMLNDDCELWICGDGDSTDYVKQASCEDERIKYLGVLSRDEILSLQTQVSVLVNPRSNTGEFVKYSFPSKTLEYLASGTPVVGYKLDGIPSEYDPYIIYINPDSPDGITLALRQVLHMTKEERSQIGHNAKLFVTQNKNNLTQANRMNRFFESLLGVE